MKFYRSQERFEPPDMRYRIIFMVMFRQRQHSEQVSPRGAHPYQCALQRDQAMRVVLIFSFELPEIRRRDAHDNACRPVAGRSCRVAGVLADYDAHPVEIISLTSPIE